VRSLEVKSKNKIEKSIFFNTYLLKMRMYNLKRTKLAIKILLVVFVVMFIFSFLPTTLACKNGHGYRNKINYRPIEDWLEYNPFGCGMYYWTAFFGDDGSRHEYWAWFDGVTAGEMLGEYNYEYSGYVREEVLRGGSLEYKVVLYVEDLYIECLNGFYFEDGSPWYNDLVMSAYIDYVFQFTFRLDKHYPGFPDWDIPAGKWKPGGRLPDFEGIIFYPVELGIHVKSFLFYGAGSGEFYEPGWTYDKWVENDPSTWPGSTGETGDVFLFHYATFDEGEQLVLPYGFSGFMYNTFAIY
jgi:hypothetical protein